MCIGCARYDDDDDDDDDHANYNAIDDDDDANYNAYYHNSGNEFWRSVYYDDYDDDDGDDHDAIYRARNSCNRGCHADAEIEDDVTDNPKINTTKRDEHVQTIDLRQDEEINTRLFRTNGKALTVILTDESGTFTTHINSVNGTPISVLIRCGQYAL